MGQLGFSFVGAAFLVALFVPNVIWVRAAKPASYHASAENRVLRTVERTGQALTTAAALAFADTNLSAWSPWSWWLIAAAALMVAYEAGWLRYFASGQTEQDLYSPLFGVPVPLATLPVAAFVLLGVYGRLIPLIVATVVLGLGHIGIHLQHDRALDR